MELTSYWIDVMCLWSVPGRKIVHFAYVFVAMDIGIAGSFSHHPEQAGHGWTEAMLLDSRAKHGRHMTASLAGTLRSYSRLTIS